VAAEAVADWAAWASAVWPRAAPALTGSGFIFVFARADESSRANVGNPPLRLTFAVSRVVEVQLADGVAFRRVDQQPFKKFPR
jgi:hypothetical protein